MCYKAEVQKKNDEKLKNIFVQEKTPLFIQEFLTGLASRAGQLNYWSTIRDMLNWMIDNNIIHRKSISDITPQDICQIRTAQMIMYFKYMKYTQSFLLSTIQTKKNQMGSFWTYLNNERMVKDNIIKNIKSVEFRPVRTNRQKFNKLPKQEDIDMMMEKIKQKKDEFVRIRNLIVVRVLRGTGLRESELAGLDMNDLFLNETYPYILVISKGNYDYSERGKDIVYLTHDANCAFKEWLKFRGTLYDIKDNEAVFLNKNGKRMNEENIKAIFRNYSQGKISPHMLRHEYTTILQRESNDMTFVQEQGRWKSPNIMLGTYDTGASRSLDVLATM